MSVFALAQEGGGQVAQIARTFGVDWPHLTAQIISFGIVCALLYWLAYHPVLAMLDERRRQIAEGLANTEKIKAALDGIAADRQKAMSEAQAQSARLIAEARTAATQLRAQEAQLAAAAAERIVREAQGAAALERTRMLADLRREIGRLVVQTTGAVIGTVLTPDQQQRLAENTARQLAASPPPGGVT